jgi:hypothetical protein
VLDFVGIDATITAGLIAVRRTGAYGLIGAGMGRLNLPWFHLLPKDGEVFNFTGSTIADLREVVTRGGGKIGERYRALRLETPSRPTRGSRRGRCSDGRWWHRRADARSCR